LKSSAPKPKALRPIPVAPYLAYKGVEPRYLAAAGFRAFQPIDEGTGYEALARLGRIELKLTDRRGRAARAGAARVSARSVHSFQRSSFSA